MNQRLLSLLTLSLSLACSPVAGDPGIDPAAPDAGVSDHTSDAGDGDHTPDAGAEVIAPVVTSVSPADGARGVSPDAHIKVVFSHPMDQASVESAWSSQILPSDAVAFSWNPAGDILTVTPDDPLPVAEGTGLDPDTVEPKAIAFAIGAGAVDDAGTALAAPLAVEFHTVRRMTVGIGYDISLSDCRTASGSASWSDDTLYVGDTWSHSSIRLVVSFALPELPAGAALERAILSATQTSATSGMYLNFGSLSAVHVRFDSVTTAYGASVLDSLGIFSTLGLSGPRSLAATRSVAGDLADGVTHAQFRLQFATATDFDDVSDLAQFSRSSLALTLTYLVK